MLRSTRGGGASTAAAAAAAAVPAMSEVCLFLSGLGSNSRLLFRWRFLTHIPPVRADKLRVAGQPASQPASHTYIHTFTASFPSYLPTEAARNETLLNVSVRKYSCCAEGLAAFLDGSCCDRL